MFGWFIHFLARARVLVADGARSANDTQLDWSESTAATSSASPPAAVHSDVRCAPYVGAAAVIGYHTTARPGAVDKQQPGIVGARCNCSSARQCRCCCHNQQRRHADSHADSHSTQAREAQIWCFKVGRLHKFILCQNCKTNLRHYFYGDLCVLV